MITHCSEYRDKYSQKDIDALKKMHTKQLLKKRDRLYVGSCGSYYSSYSPECQQCCLNEKFNMEQVKQELATREHILNKKESKALRKKRIKEGR